MKRTFFTRKIRRKLRALFVLLLFCGAIYFVSSYVVDRAVLNFSIRAYVHNAFDRVRGIANTDSLRWVGEPGTEFFSFDNHIISVSNREIKYFDFHMNEITSLPLGYTNPKVRITHPYMVVADKGGNEWVLVRGRTIVFTGETEENIANFDVAENGFVTMVKESRRAKHDVFVYDTRGNVLYTYASTRDFVYAAMYSPQMRAVLLNKITVASTTVGSIFEAHDIREDRETMVFSHPRGGDVFPEWGILNGNMVYAYSDRSLFVLNRRGEEVMEVDLQPGISVCTVTNQGSIAITRTITSEEAGTTMSVVEIYNSNGRRRGTFEFDGNFRSITSYNNIICVSTGNDFLFLSESGRLQGRISSENELLGIITIRNNTVFAKIRNGLIIKQL